MITPEPILAPEPAAAPWPRAARLVKTIACLSFLVPLAGYLVNALTFRFNGDDYCYLALIKINGFWKTQLISYFQNTPYSGDRYSATFLTGLFSFLSPGLYGIATVLCIAVWIGGFVWINRSLSRLGWLKLDWLESVLTGLLVVVFTIYTAPNITQALFWRAGMVAYTLPLVGLCLNAGYILEGYSRQKQNFILWIVPFFLAFLTGGFSETGAALQTVVIGLVFIASVWVNYHYKDKTSLGWVGPAFLGSALALIAVIISPANTYRLAGVKTIPNLALLVKLTAAYTRDFILESLRGQPIPVMITFLIALMLSIGMNQAGKHEIRSNLNKIAASLIITTGLIASCIAPSVYAESGYPEARVLFTARWLLILGLVCSGFFVGQIGSGLLDRLKLAREGFLASLAVLLLLGLYPIYIAPKIISQIPPRQRLAALWDARDQLIRADIKSGILKIEVKPLDHMVQGVTELSADPGFWYNTCAAGYYGVTFIQAK